VSTLIETDMSFGNILLSTTLTLGIDELSLDIFWLNCLPLFRTKRVLVYRLKICRVWEIKM